ncbi:hypothetical protein Tco_0209513 [Tanacetum coccineum]
MVVIDDHDMIDTRKGSIPRDVIDTGEGSIPMDVFDVGEGSNTRAQEEIDEKPKVGDIFDSFDAGYDMYKAYAEKGRFNVRPTIAHRLKVALMSGYDKVRGTPGDYRNFKRSRYQQKDRKPSQNDKTEHGMEKTVQNQGQSPKMPKSESILLNQQLQTGAELKNTIRCKSYPLMGRKAQ